MPLSMFDVPFTEHVYTFVDKNKRPTHIAASSLRAAVETRLTPIDAEISPSLVEALKRGDLGVEEHHALKLPLAALMVPIMVCEWDDCHIIADGAHRLWRRWQRGDTTFPALVVPEPVWRLFVLYDVPGSGHMWDEFNRTAKVR